MPDQFTFDQGTVDSRPPELLRKGEMQKSEGGYYKPGDPVQLHKLPAPRVFGDTGSAKKVDGVAVCQFDDGGTDKLLALSDGVLYGATPGVSAAFSSLATGLSGTHLAAAHYANRFFLATGAENRVLKPDGTLRSHGMIAPKAAPLVTALLTGGAVFRPTASTGTFDDPELAYDAGEFDTFAGATLSAAGAVTETWTDFSAGTTDADTGLFVKFGVAGGQGVAGDAGVSATGDFNATVKIEISEDGGATFTTRIEETITHGRDPLVYFSDVTDTVNHNLIQVKATLTYNSGAGQVILQVLDIRIATGSTGGNVTSGSGFVYAFTEWDEDEQIESAPSPNSRLMDTTTFVEIDVTLPSSTQNSNTTHWKIYRTPDGATAIDQLGLVATVLATETNYRDDFEDTANSINEQQTPVVPQLPITIDGVETPFPRDAAPPALKNIRTYKGSLIGFDANDERLMRYSVPGLPDSWPAIYTIEFQGPERDVLLDGIEVGNAFITMAGTGMWRLDDIPRSFAGTFVPSRLTQIQNAPGGVGVKALTAFAIGGRPMAAWISHQGVWITDGHSTFRISTDMDWQSLLDLDKSNWALEYDEQWECLVMAYATSGTVNDRYRLFHMAPEQRKSNEQPKITGPTLSSVADLAMGQVGNIHRLYFGHGTDGKVYLMNFDGQTVDQSSAIDSGGTWRLKTISGQQYEGWSDVAAIRGSLRHSDFGAGEECTVTWRAKRDVSDYTHEVVKTVSLNGKKGTAFFIGRAGDSHEIEIEHTGQAQGALTDVRVNDVQHGAADTRGAA